MDRTFDENATAAAYRTLRNVETAITELRRAGFDLRKVSIVAKDRHRNGGDGTDLCLGVQAGSAGTSWERTLKMPSGRTIYCLQDDLIVVSGPLSECVAAALDNPVVFGPLGTLSAAMYILGISASRALGYEEDVRNEKFLVIANGTAEEVTLARKTLQSVNGGSPPA